MIELDGALIVLGVFLGGCICGSFFSNRLGLNKQEEPENDEHTCRDLCSDLYWMGCVHPTCQRRKTPYDLLTEKQLKILRRLYPEHIKRCEKEADMRVEKDEPRKTIKHSEGFETKTNEHHPEIEDPNEEETDNPHLGNIFDETVLKSLQKEDGSVKESICPDCAQDMCGPTEMKDKKDCPDFILKDTPILCDRCLSMEGCAIAISGDRMTECENFDDEAGQPKDPSLQG